MYDDDYDREMANQPPGGWGVLDEGTETTDAREVQNEFGTFFAFGDWDDPDIIVSLECACGNTNSFAGPQYERYFTILQANPLIVRCGECEDEYRAKLIQKGEPRYPLVVKCTDPIAWVDSSAAIRKDIMEETPEVESHPCPECGKLLWDAHAHEGPEAPEIGWKYYECPSCEERLRPETVENASDDAEPADS